MRNQKRVGLTLVELLVTLAVVLLLAAIVLPSVKNMLVDRKSTQTATVVRNFIEAARAKAIGSNSTIAVVLERGSSIPLDINGDGILDGTDMIETGNSARPYRFKSATAYDPLTEAGGVVASTNFAPYNTCVRLSLAERPNPRHCTTSAAWTGKTVTVADLLTPATISLISSVLPGANPKAGLFYLNIPFPGATARADQMAFVQQLDLLPYCDISLGGDATRYTMQEVYVTDAAGMWIACLSNTSSDSDAELSVPPLTPVGVFTEFTVYPKLRPITGQSVNLPRGMCIDLSISGFSERGYSASLDRRARFSSQWLSAGASVPEATQLRPVYLEFGSDGLLKTVWANGTGSLASDLVPTQMVDDVYLHIGKNDQVTMPAMPNPQNPIVPNMYDEKSYVLRLSAKSGSISAAPVAYYETQAQLQGIDFAAMANDATRVGTALSLSRLGVFGQPLTAQ